MHAPQIIMIALIVFGLSVSMEAYLRILLCIPFAALVLFGLPDSIPAEHRVTLVVLTVLLLWWGGFWN